MHEPTRLIFYTLMQNMMTGGGSRGGIVCVLPLAYLLNRKYRALLETVVFHITS